MANMQRLSTQTPRKPSARMNARFLASCRFGSRTRWMDYHVSPAFVLIKGILLGHQTPL
jgi:hypothetical protein